MADLSITVNSVTSQESRAAQFALARVNESRVVKGLPAFTTIEEMIMDHLNNRVIPMWITQEADTAEQAQGITHYFKNADDATRAQVIALMNAQNPQN